MTLNGRLNRLGSLARGFMLTAAALLGATQASAQTVNLTVVKDATLRGGTYANTKHGSESILVTRASDDATYARRAALTFDTETTIPDNSTIQSATLVLTVKGGNSETRQLRAYGLPVSFEEPSATWIYRNSSRWTNAGGDTTGSYTSGTVTATVGSQTSFDVTQHVQAVLNGKYGSRYSRFLVVDSGGSSRDSYKEFHARESTDSARRPRLIVTYGSSTSTTTSTTTTSTTTTSTTTTTTSSTAAKADSAGDIAMGPEHVTARAGKWVVESNSGAINGKVVRHPNGNLAKITTAYAAPTHYFEMTFEAKANTAYRLWVHGRADNDYWGNDSVHAQFSGSVTSTGSAAYRIGTTSSAEVNLEDCNGCGLSGWTWQDNGYGSGVLGPKIYFATTGVHTIRVQTREDGLAIDRILLSAATYMSSPPGSSSTPAPAPAPAPQPEPAPAPAPSTSNTLKVLEWNIHHGVGTDGVYDINRLAHWMSVMNPDVIVLNEVEKYTSWGNEDQPARFKALLEQKTGRKWYSHFSQEFGQWSSNGKGHQILSVYPFSSVGHTTTTPSDGLRGAGAVSQAGIVVNGRTINVFAAHLDPYDQAMRLTQAKEVIRWAASFAENRILAGDMNAWPDQSSILELNKYYRDSWVDALNLGKAYAPSNITPYGATKKGRIDYIMYSKGASNLVVLQSKVYDTRDSRGHMPSDHRPVMTTFEVR